MYLPIRLCRSRLLLLAPALAVAAAIPVRPVAAFQVGVPHLTGEMYTLPGDEVTIRDLVGSVTVKQGVGTNVIVNVARTGSDSGRLQILNRSVDGCGTLAVIFPGDQIRYADGQAETTNTTLQVADDGRIGYAGGRRVTISDDPSGLDARADLEVLVPLGKTVSISLAVGRVEVSNTANDMHIQTVGAPILVSKLTGNLRVNTSSGDIDVMHLQGDADLASSSGKLRMQGIVGGRTTARLSSGNIVAQGVNVSTLNITSASGNLHVGSSRVRDLDAESSSGNIDIVLEDGLQRARLYSTSGSVTARLAPSLGAHLDAALGTGELVLDAPVQVITREPGRFVAEVGDSVAQVDIRTSSGSIRIASSRTIRRK